MFYKTEDLLASIKTRTLAPSSQSTFQDSDLIQLANEELQIALVPDIQTCREDYFLKSKQLALVAAVNHYRLPERAIGNDLKEIFYLDSGGNRQALPRMRLHDMPASTTVGTTPNAFYMKADEVVLVPTPAAAAGSLELWYYNRPNKLVSTSMVAKILGITVGASQATISVDTDITASVGVGSKVDFTITTSPFDNWAEDVLIQSISGTQIVVNNSDIQNEAGVILPQVGDYICPAQQTNIPQIPQEFHPVLAQMVAARLMESLGDLQKLQSVNAKLSEMRRQAMQLVVNRVESEVEHVNNRSGLLAQIGSWNRRSFVR